MCKFRLGNKLRQMANFHFRNEQLAGMTDLKLLKLLNRFYCRFQFALIMITDK